MTQIKNRLLIAGAGAGKTHYLIQEALKISAGKVLITTYTEANAREIKKTFIKQCKCVPSHVTIQTWASFLLQHGARPFQGSLISDRVEGYMLVESVSGVKYRMGKVPVQYNQTTELRQHYFSNEMKCYSDKLAKFVIACDDASGKAVIKRMASLFSHIFVDEVQDMAGYDLEILKRIFGSDSYVLLVGDPRQVTYLTHYEKKYRQYSEGGIKEFVLEQCKKLNCIIDEDSLNDSYRCNDQICKLSSSLYPQFKSTGSKNYTTTSHDGVFLISKSKLADYLTENSPVQLRLNKLVKVSDGFGVYNFGESKGLTFDRVVIYPTADMLKWIKDRSQSLAFRTKAQLYVALTRARYSVAIVCDENETSEGLLPVLM